LAGRWGPTGGDLGPRVIPCGSEGRLGSSGRSRKLPPSPGSRAPDDLFHAPTRRDADSSRRTTCARPTAPARPSWARRYIDGLLNRFPTRPHRSCRVGQAGPRLGLGIPQSPNPRRPRPDLAPGAIGPTAARPARPSPACRAASTVRGRGPWPAQFFLGPRPVGRKRGCSPACGLRGRRDRLPTDAGRPFAVKITPDELAIGDGQLAARPRVDGRGAGRRRRVEEPSHDGGGAAWDHPPSRIPSPWSRFPAAFHEVGKIAGKADHDGPPTSLETFTPSRLAVLRSRAGRRAPVVRRRPGRPFQPCRLGSGLTPPFKDQHAVLDDGPTSCALAR